MNTRRVAVTGIGGITAFGRDWQSIQAAFKAEKNAVKYMDWHERFPELEAQLGAPIENYAPPKHWTRKQLRSMGRVSYLCVDAAEQALTDAGLLGDESITDGRMGVACGSSSGSTKDIGDVGELLLTGTSRNFSANTYVRMMPHTTAANIGIFFGLKGRIIPTSSACSSGSQGIGYAYEAIKYGLTDMMLAGGGEEFFSSEVYVFDSLYAASRRNGEPEKTPRPYDANRDGLVIGEGAGIFVLEELEHAKRRGAIIYAELVGYGANSDAYHISTPRPAPTRKAQSLPFRRHCNTQVLRPKTSAGLICTAPGRTTTTVWKAVPLQRFSATIRPARPPSRKPDTRWVRRAQSKPRSRGALPTGKAIPKENFRPSFGTGRTIRTFPPST